MCSFLSDNTLLVVMACFCKLFNSDWLFVLLLCRWKSFSFWWQVHKRNICKPVHLFPLIWAFTSKVLCCMRWLDTPLSHVVQVQFRVQQCLACLFSKLAHCTVFQRSNKFAVCSAVPWSKPLSCLLFWAGNSVAASEEQCYGLKITKQTASIVVLSIDKRRPWMRNVKLFLTVCCSHSDPPLCVITQDSMSVGDLGE